MPSPSRSAWDTTERYIDEADVIETVAANVIDDMLAEAKPAPRSLKVV